MEPETLMLAQSRELFSTPNDPNTVETRVAPPMNSDDGSTVFYMEGGHQMAGIGHSFQSFNGLVNQARQENLLMRANFDPHGAHHVSLTRAHGYFFDNLFMTPIPEGSECTRVVVKKYYLLEKMVRLAKEQVKQNPVPCVIMQVGVARRRTDGLDINLPYFRTVFEQNDGDVRRSIIQRKWEDRRPDAVNVAIHIRRGDIIRWLGKLRYRGDAGVRLFVVSAYTSVLNQLFSKLAKYGVKDINVHIFCEGMEPPAEVPTVSGGMFDLRKEITFDASNQNVTFIPGDPEAIQAFDDMCHSDILITGGSDFSYLAAYLCSTPLVLAMPTFLPYDFIPNALLLDVGWGDYQVSSPVDDTLTLVDHAEFDETKFDELWQDRMTLMDGTPVLHASPN